MPAPELANDVDVALDLTGFSLYRWIPRTNAVIWSDRMKAMWGLPSRADADHFVFLRGIHPDDREVVEKSIAATLDATGSRTYDAEYRVIGIEDGIERWVATRGRMFFDDREPSHLIGVARDITTSKAIEKKLQDSETRLQSAIEHADLSVYEWDVETNVIRWDDRWKNLWGVPADAAIDLDLMQRAIHPDDRDFVNRQIAASIDARVGTYEGEFRIRRLNDGEERWVSGRGRTFFRNGQPMRQIGISQDVTERKHAEHALRESEERLRLASEAAGIYNWEVDLVTGAIIASPNAHKFRGSALPKNVEEISPLLHPDDRERMRASREHAIRTGERMDTEYRIIHASGGILWMRAQGIALRDSNGRPQRFIGLTQDITERKRAEEERERLLLKLQESQRLLAGIADATPDIVFLHDVGTHHSVYRNRQVLRLLGYTDEDYEQLPAGSIIHPDDRAAHQKTLERLAVLPDGEVMEFDCRFLRKDGTARWFSTRAVTFSRDSSGQPHLVLGVASDITARKRAEQSLRESEQRLRLATEAARIYTWDLDLATGKTFFSPNAEPVRGFAAPKNLAEAASFLHPDDREAMLEARERAISTGQPLDLESRLMNPINGDILWIRTQGVVIHDSAGNAERLIGICQDITEMRHSRAELEGVVAQRTAQLVKAQEDERLRIARELHDELGQQLTALKLGLESMGAQMGASVRIDQLTALTRALDQNVDRLVYELRPPVLEDLGLEFALANYVEQFAERGGIPVDFQSSALKGLRLPEVIETTLYRVVQEALTNILRHAHAGKASVILERRGNELQLIVEDDGSGFDADDTAARRRGERRLGLTGIRERIALIGGSVTVESTIGRGTSVFARVSI